MLWKRNSQKTLHLYNRKEEGYQFIPKIGLKKVKQNYRPKIQHQARQKITSTVHKPYFNNGKKDQTEKLAMDSEKINKCIHKNKYQVPNIELLLDIIAQILERKKRTDTILNNWPSIRIFAVLDPETKKQGSFSLIGGHATGTYQFQTGFYGITNMPAEFRLQISIATSG